VSEYAFTVRFDIRAAGSSNDQVVERLGAAGCDDCIVGVGKPGCLALTFDREAGSARDAVLGAIHDVTRVVPSARLLEASPDLVGLSDLAELVGRTRQNMRKLLLDCDATAPAPLHQGSASVWRLAPVLEWLRTEKSYAVPDELLDLARTTMQVNLAVDGRLRDENAQREIRTLVM